MSGQTPRKRLHAYRIGTLSLCLSLLASAESSEIHHRDVYKVRRAEEWSYPVIALRNPRERLIRIYGQFSPAVVGNNSHRGERSQIAGCAMLGAGRQGVVPLTRPVEEFMRYEDDFTDNLMHVANYIIDCHDPGEWATSVTVRLDDGKDAGRALEIITMETTHKGKLGVCSQPLHTNRAWLHDWAKHNLGIGADAIIMHVPRGPHIDELFGDRRLERLEFNAALAERSPLDTGTEPLQRFEDSAVEWREYWPSPTAMYYAEELMLSSCHYHLRYAYTYSIQFDIDEFWYPGQHTPEKTLPAFLDKHMHPDAASMGFFQVLYPLDCPTRVNGDYASRFTLRHGIANQIKPAVRPIAVKRMHVHWVLDVMPEWREEHAAWAEHYWEAPIETAFLKHIRPNNEMKEDSTVHTFPCRFGAELDPKGETLVAAI